MSSVDLVSSVSSLRYVIIQISEQNLNISRRPPICRMSEGTN